MPGPRRAEPAKTGPGADSGVAKILVVDDDPSLLRALRLGLGAAGHAVITAGSGGDGMAEAARSAPEVVILDLGLPDVDGLAVCRDIRAWSDVPIIVLSATGTEDRKVAALNEGADDYVTKPFGMAELEARIRAVLRHRKPAADTGPRLEVGALVLDRVHHQAQLGSVPMELTAKEFDVLAFLVEHAGKVCTHQMILSAVWGTTYTREAQYLHVYIHRLRQKLGDHSGVVIRSSPGIGYSLAPEQDHFPPSDSEEENQATP